MRLFVSSKANLETETKPFLLVNEISMKPPWQIVRPSNIERTKQMEAGMKQNLATRLINIAALTIGGAALWMAAAASTAAASTVVARIDVSDQTMQVIVDGQPTYEWKVSTAGRGYRTPRGTFSPTRMHKMWYSRKYDNAPMPHSIFFHGGYAVHATDAVKRLGQPASHGCVRLHPKNAASLYSLVKSHGSANMRIVIVD